MPLVRIDLAQGHPVEDGRDIGEVVYDAMRATLNVPEGDRFQVITSHPAAELAINPNYLGIARTKDCIWSRSFGQGSLAAKRPNISSLRENLC